uniref:Cytochrome p450 n=1 Tax=Croton stellatopilosus TaxID=431156 RepID=A0A3G2CK25_9ROSI|nr:cytochrome p450 [Croton stellatopilosus]
MISQLFCLSLFFIFFLHFFKRKWQNLPPTPIAIPIIGHFYLLGPLIHHSFRDISSRLGPLIYLKLGSVSCVVASTPELAKHLLKTHELSFSSRQNSLAISSLTCDSSLAFAPYGPYWKFVRKLATSELLGNRMLNRFLVIRNKELHYFLAGFCSRTGQSVNVTQELIKLTNNIISMVMLNMRSSDSDSEAEILRNAIRKVTQIFGEFNVSDFIWWCKYFDLQGFQKRIDEIYKECYGWLEKLVAARERERKSNTRNGVAKDFLDILLDAMADENAEIRLTRTQVKALILDFFTAATDTMATTLEWAMAELINHPKILEKAREEIKRVVGDNRIVQESDNPNLEYIRAILKETFRFHPPVPLVSRKSIEECKINGYKIPANSLMFVNIWSIGRDPKYWNNPLEFKPERFLESNSNVDIRGQHFELLPFGSGRRSCPGVSLAMEILPTTLAAMIQCFDWKVDNASGTKTNGGEIVLDMSERSGFTAPRFQDLVCIPVPRLPHILQGLCAT